MALLTVISSVVDLAGPWPWKFVLDSVLGDHPLPPWLAPFFDLQKSRVPLLIAIVVAELLIALTTNLLNVASNYVETSLDQWMVLDFRSDLFQHAQRLSLAFHDRRRSGMLIYIINSQGEAAASLVMSVPAMAHSLITLLGMFWIVFCMDRGLALLALGVLPFLVYSVRYYTTRIQDRLMQTKMLEGESLSIIHEAISMLRVIVAFGRESFEFQRFREQAARAVNARVGITVRQTFFSLAVNMTTAVGTAAVLGYGAYRGLQGRLTPGDLAVVLFYIGAVYKPLESISYTLGSLQDNFVSLRIAFDVLDTVPEVREAVPAKTLQRACGRIAFQGIDFAYAGRTDTLCDVSFEVQPGQIVAIVGPTGAGKTTLISLIPRFYDAQMGRILLDDIDIRDLSLPRSATRLAWSSRSRCCFPDRSWRTSATGGWRPATRRSWRPPARPMPTTSSCDCPSSTRQNWASAGAAFRRRAAADLRRPGFLERRPRLDSRRADLRDRFQDRGRDSRRPGPLDDRPHQLHDRPPPFDRPPRGPDPGDGPGPYRAARNARGTGRRRRPVPPIV